MDNQTTANTLPAVPTRWPGAFGIYEYSKNAVKFNLNPLLLFAVASLIITFLPELFLSKGDNGSGFISILVNVLGLVLQIAITIIVLKAVKRERISANEAFSQSTKFIVKYFFLMILLGLAAAASLLLFIVPFFIVMPRLILAPYFMIDKNLGIGESINKSWEQTKGHSLKVWGILGVTFLMAIACLLLVGIYFLFMYTASSAILYFFVTSGSINQETHASSPSPKPLSEQN